MMFFLKALKEIFKEGIITEEEYQSKRQSLVDKL
ncbi:SHOCT domain-containing protein [Dolichospermum circinale CS-1225]|nr:SHOCT domain-containing protein [Dolichospermum circinale]MDB9466796.1 SHOCT domain-containing protein [Dolichospermum circinale CS-539/09]MDB9472474.1 SHOCT domain-containing protein [Dolichospermum circinale CS-539]MDB9524265.1 SHOCT domain-containing protein [Dolichospermum circinale CS-1225]